MKKYPILNHIAINVHDLKKSADFYRDIIGLDTLPEPFKTINMHGLELANTASYTLYPGQVLLRRMTKPLTPISVFLQ